jgi:hypothetical protein
MFGRRSHQRFTVSSPAEGTLRVLRDVTVERIAHESVVVVTRHPGASGELLELELGEAGGIKVDVMVTDSRPVLADGAVRHRLTLQPVHADSEGLRGALSDDMTNGTAVPGVLTLRVPVRMLNCSATGCLLESTVRQEKSTISSLRLRLDGEDFMDDVQVVRCQAVQGSSSYQLGVEFLWIVPPTSQSLRRSITVARLQQGSRN